MSKRLLRVFAVLDVIMLGQILIVGHVFYRWSRAWENPAMLATNLMRAALIASFVFTAIGLWRGKRWGCVVYYVQFPVRIWTRMLSFTFIETTAHTLGMPDSLRATAVVLIALEVARLAATVRAHADLPSRAS